MRRQIFDFHEVKDTDYVEVVFPNGCTISGDWYQDHILDAYVKRDRNNAKFYVTESDPWVDVDIAGLGKMSAPMSTLNSVSLMAFMAAERCTIKHRPAMAVGYYEVSDEIYSVLDSLGFYDCVK